VDGLSTHRGGGIPDERHTPKPHHSCTHLFPSSSSHTHTHTIFHTIQSSNPSTHQAFKVSIALQQLWQPWRRPIPASLPSSPSLPTHHRLYPSEAPNTSASCCQRPPHPPLPFPVTIKLRCVSEFSAGLIVNVVVGVDEFGSNWVCM
jgi:hypothetical protein